MSRIRKAVLPVAGLGTRMLPATRVLPKEMLPVVDKPIVQYAVEEAMAAGIEEIVLVTGRGKILIEDHFDRAVELFETLARRGKRAELEELVAQTPVPGAIVATRQQEPKGLGHAVWCARHLVGREPFAVVLVDDLIDAPVPCLAQMVEVHARTGGNVLAVMEVPFEQTARYGIVAPGEDDGRVVEVRGLVEKPRPENAPSRLAVIGRYILMPEVMDELARHEVGAGGEIQLTDALAKLIGRQAFHGLRFEGRRYDCGDRLGYLEAVVALAAKRPDIGPAFRALLAQYL
ncbi:MAG: UTP--glucose-1-phosphate uridylyltransferase GalU [Geminicoccaceae bacterium]|nr:UTP--glucose-1-phosphate uridylyltransferase GalU [Geminicoccaceae bacterium]MCX7630634.1 UTP--glucose-1-phosphate uridylyltransferase GalU [Geminicoccaceae bacterium]MDW8369215.1 UTP--glucose-1-phosphate uridylyltransferase GalU [Geminicoccaceae bacterium]